VDGDLDAFRAAGWMLASLSLVKGSEGNLSTFDGRTFCITRTGAELEALSPRDVLCGTLLEPPDGSSSDVQVHRDLYERMGPGAVAHAHPPGIVPAEGPPGHHGIYAFSHNLAGAVERIILQTRLPPPPTPPALTVEGRSWKP
jgi:hypothetical protein